MSRYFVSAVMLACSALLPAKASALDQPGGGREDALIVQGLVQDENREYARAERIFLELYRLTKRSEYLVQAAKEAMMPGGDPALVVPGLKRWIAVHASYGGDLRPVRILAALYAREGQLQEAESLVDRWLARSDEVENLKLAATLKEDLGKYSEAVKLLQKAYRLSGDEKFLLAEVTILEKKLDDPREAIRLLESHLRLDPEATVAAYFKLIELYARQKKLHKVQELYEKLYEKDPQEYFLKKIVKLSLYNRDFAGLTRFLEKHSRGNEDLLYMLYKEQDLFDRAIALAHRRYQETGRPKWLAEEAILTYEKARKAKSVTPELLERFTKLFDRAIKEGADESLYLNYYGYTLIDHDLDIARGIALVRRALEQQPGNPYYLDSLAWGLYKEGKCAEAAGVMQKVVAAEGLREPEIKTHWESIRRCVEKPDGAQRGENR